MTSGAYYLYYSVKNSLAKSECITKNCILAFNLNCSFGTQYSIKKALVFQMVSNARDSGHISDVLAQPLGE